MNRCFQSLRFVHVSCGKLGRDTRARCGLRGSQEGVEELSPSVGRRCMWVADHDEQVVRWNTDHSHPSGIFQIAQWRCSAYSWQGGPRIPGQESISEGRHTRRRHAYSSDAHRANTIAPQQDGTGDYVSLYCGLDDIEADGTPWVQCRALLP